MRKTHSHTKMLLSILLILLLSFTFIFSACERNDGVRHSTNLMENVHADSIDASPLDMEFISNCNNFGIELFKHTYEKDSNHMISPLSVMIALSLSANGANADTLSNMLEVMVGGYDIDTLNEQLYAYIDLISSKQLSISNSIWIKDEPGFNVLDSFLEANARYYKASAYKSAFDNKTISDINNWVNSKTDGMIERILNEIDPTAMMFLINAICFDANWEHSYDEIDNDFSTFNNSNETTSAVEYMSSIEKGYVSKNASAFTKPYDNGKFAFMGILPNHNFEDYIKSFNSNTIIDLLNTPQTDDVCVILPKFKMEYEIKLKDTLLNMGMINAFGDNADFSLITGNKMLNISEVVHKTFIEVNEKGTRAAAVTNVEMSETSIPLVNQLYFNKPFIYAIIDTTTNTPIFIGTISNMN